MVGWLAIVALALWFFFGSPSKDVANWFWSDSAAPWEAVDAFYYPDRYNLSRVETLGGFASVEACRIWVHSQAAAHNDHRITRGEYECGVGYLENLGSVKVYRISVR